MMAEMKQDAHGELLCVKETITNDTADGAVVEYTCAQNREVGSPERGLLMPSEEDIARVIEKISRLTDQQFNWFIRQMQHLGFSPCGETYLGPAQQSK